jgi:N-acetylglucosaminyl-diphospho-decaprenol L-rhamnosyltransferase
MVEARKVIDQNADSLGATSPTARPDVSIVIVGLNAREYVRQSLASLAAAEWRGYSWEVVYVDNGSKDGTPAMVAEQFPEVVVVANRSNLGFCKAANQGARRANGRHFYFLNDDTIVKDDAISLLIEYADAHPEVGTVGSRLVYPDGTEQFSGRRFPALVNGVWGRRSLLTRLFPDAPWVKKYLCADQLNGSEPFAVDWVSAAGQIVRREVFERVGGFAEDYYYWHEAVFCDRISAAGNQVLLHPRSTVVHFEGKGSGPRPFKTQRFHIVDFHWGAFRCYCEHYRLRWWHPLRGVAATALATRAGCLLAVSAVRSGWRAMTTARAGAEA